MPEKKHVILDAVALFNLQIKDPPKILKDLQLDIIMGKVTAVIPTIAISEILWKKRKEGAEQLEKLKIAYSKWKEAHNIVIDGFDVKILDKMIELKRSYELHDEIIALTCHKYKTKTIYTNDPKFKDFWGLNPVSW